AITTEMMFCRPSGVRSPRATASLSAEGPHYHRSEQPSSDDRAWAIAGHKVDDEQHDPDQKQEPGDLRRHGGHAVNPKQARDQSNHEEYQRVIEHAVLLI